MNMKYPAGTATESNRWDQTVGIVLPNNPVQVPYLEKLKIANLGLSRPRLKVKLTTGNANLFPHSVEMHTSDKQFILGNGISDKHTSHFNRVFFHFYG